jgi:myo-inositol 2-dehydrogenase / D-chiro-inositol 1-dehydrogenase
MAADAVRAGALGQLVFATWRFGGEAGTSAWQAGYFNDADRQFHRTFDKHVDAMLHALRGRQPPPVHARAGHRALVLALAIIASFETGTRVDVPVLPVREGA